MNSRWEVPTKTTGHGLVCSGVVVQFGAVRSDREQSGLVQSRVRFGSRQGGELRQSVGFWGSLEQLHTLTLSIQKVLGFLEQLHSFDR